MTRPILYSFRRCPYAMRARLAIRYSGIEVELREIDLNDVPEELSAISHAELVPVLVFPDDKIIDESWDIAKWAVAQNDPDTWLGTDQSLLQDAEMLVETNDYSFKKDLDHYKYADRHPEFPMQHYRSECEEFIIELEERLTEHRYLSADTFAIADIAVLPFIRQFALVDKTWFDATPYTKVQNWLNEFLQSPLLESVMTKYPLWKKGDEPIIF